VIRRLLLLRYDREDSLETAGMAWWLLVIVSIASIPLAGEMARERNRSSKTWLWAAVAVGPLAPLALAVLGDKRPTRASQAR
jgi:hypothetical protein